MDEIPEKIDFIQHNNQTMMTTSDKTAQKNKINFIDFLKNHQIIKEKDGTTSSNVSLPTNTRIGEKTLQIYGGSYNINDDEYPLFLELYYNEIFLNKKKEYLTEKQLEKDGPILVDLDLRFSLETKNRIYTEEHIEDLLNLYLEKLKDIYEFDDETKFPIYVFEKSNIKKDEKKNLVKDGIHIIIGIQSDHDMQQLLRKEIVTGIEEIWGDFPIINTWDEVLDEGISKGHTNWQLYGSTKPGNEAYNLTKVYEIGYDTTDNEFTGLTPLKTNDLNIKNIFPKLSARYKNNPAIFYKNSFITRLQNAISTGEIVSVYGDKKTKQRTSNNITSTLNNDQNTNNIFSPSFILQIKTMDQLEQLKIQFVDEINDKFNQEYNDMKDAYNYCMILPQQYYNDFSKWIRVGWALRNINNRLFLAWVLFSSRSTTKFHINDIPSLYEKWQTFDLNNPNGLTKWSIMHWAKIDAIDSYNNIRKSSIDYFVEQTIYVYNKIVSEDKKTERDCGDYDLAVVLFQLFKDNFVCVSIKANVWYEYKNHRWVEVDSGTTLRKAISNDMRDIYRDKMTSIINQSCKEKDKADKNESLLKVLDFKMNKISEILVRLARTNDKKNIMTEAKELFFDPTFLEKLDTNPYLLCFNNGVIDFKEKRFRKGYPDDYISKTTNNDYVELNTSKHAVIINEINDFMRKLFPIKELYEYMWEHLASTLIGTSSNQTFNMYIGVGQNGKSVLVSLMECVLGQYKGDVPLSLVTDRRTKIGGLAPEIVALKGIRYAVMQEPSKGDRINEGIMKQLTSGIDPIQARAPYMPQSITFIPQFKLVVCSNEFMEIKSQDHGTWRRIRVVDFLSMFVEKPVTNDPDKPYQYILDKNIKEKFASWKEVFASMLVKKAMETNGNVRDCKLVMQSSNDYRNSQDYIAEFIADKIIVNKDGKIMKSELTQEFNVWYQGTYGKGGPSPKDVQSYMDKKFGPFKIHKCWKGVSINYDMELIDNIEDTSNTNNDNDDDHDDEFDDITVLLDNKKNEVSDEEDDE